MLLCLSSFQLLTKAPAEGTTQSSTGSATGITDARDRVHMIGRVACDVPALQKSIPVFSLRVTLEATTTRAARPAPGGYGFFVRETVDEVRETSHPGRASRRMAH